MAFGVFWLPQKPSCRHREAKGSYSFWFPVETRARYQPGISHAATAWLPRRELLHCQNLVLATGCSVEGFACSYLPRLCEHDGLPPCGPGDGCVCECVCVRSCHPLILVLRAGIVSLVTCSCDFSFWSLDLGPAWQASPSSFMETYESK